MHCHTWWLVKAFPCCGETLGPTSKGERQEVPVDGYSVSPPGISSNIQLIDSGQVQTFILCQPRSPDGLLGTNDHNFIMFPRKTSPSSRWTGVFLFLAALCCLVGPAGTLRMDACSSSAAPGTNTHILMLSSQLISSHLTYFHSHGQTREFQEMRPVWVL